ncbi:hypothetical protein JTB14_006400 [Gonioctena quinquepunctata]|nr:hypothetical protein JTB14_006400 [Gonioctena quinquepunctata]
MRKFSSGPIQSISLRARISRSVPLALIRAQGHDTPMPLALERPAVKFCCYAVYLSWRQAFGALVLSALRIGNSLRVLLAVSAFCFAVGSSTCFKMADENAVPGPSDP